MIFTITIDDALLAQANAAILSSFNRLAADQKSLTPPTFGEPEIKSTLLSILQSFIIQDQAQQTELDHRTFTQDLTTKTAVGVNVSAQIGSPIVNLPPTNPATL
jgi:hypothetical protein